ncbi:hypothetical protein AB0I77_32505 [Streptomyces sp. NPDC050619]|uniref:DUF7848 domain-containing protein n=1 Tax=Streptomyces sp. NPDC050619 TaxID=3157214 RepID=UPI00341EC93C
MDGETSPPSEDFAEPQNWVLQHCGRHPVAWLCHFAGPLLITAIAASCGFVIGVAFSPAAADR